MRTYTFTVDLTEADGSSRRTSIFAPNIAEAKTAVENRGATAARIARFNNQGRHAIKPWMLRNGQWSQSDQPLTDPSL